MQNLVTLTTSIEGLTLRELVPEDDRAYFNALWEDELYMVQWEGTASMFPTVGAVRASIENSRFLYALNCGIWLGDDFIGKIGLRKHKDLMSVAYVGYWVVKRCKGRGYATAATVAIAHYAFRTLGYGQISAEVHNGNEASERVLRKAGFTWVMRNDVYTLFQKLKGIETAESGI